MVVKKYLERVIYDSLGNPIATVNSGQLVTTLKDSSGNEQFGFSAQAPSLVDRSNAGYMYITDGGQEVSIESVFFGTFSRNALMSNSVLMAKVGALQTEFLPTIGYAPSVPTTSLAVAQIDSSGNEQYGLSAQATVDSHGHLLVNTINHEEEVALGLVTGEKSLRKFGRNATVGGSYEPIADDGFTFATDLDMSISSAQPMEVIHASDLSAGNGAKKIVVEGVDGSGNETSEPLTLGAASPTPLVNSYMWINRAYVTEVGSNGSNIGDINIQTTAGATPASKKYAIIPADEGQTLQCIFYVPNDYTYGLIIKKWDVRTGSGKAGNARLRTKKQALIGTEESWRTRDTLRFYQNHVIVPYEESPLIVAPNSLVRIEGLVDAGTADIAANFWGHLQ